MASMKCMNCGLVNFSGSVTCRRCETSLLDRVPPPGPPMNPLINSGPLPQQGFPPQQGFANYPPPQQGFAGYPPPPPQGGYMQYPPPNHHAMPPPLPPQVNAPFYGAPPNAASYGAPPAPQGFVPPPPMPFYGGPYAQAPYAQVPGIWQDGEKLVTTRDVVLPDRCVKCNGPANGYRLMRKLRWHSPVYYLLIFVGWLVYVIVALIIRKTAKVQVGLCERHLNNRRIALYVSWFLCLAGIGAIVLAFASGSGGAGFFGLMLLIAAGIYGSLATRIIYPSKIDERFAWIKGVDREYLSQFPQWPNYH